MCDPSFNDTYRKREQKPFGMLNEQLRLGLKNIE